MSYILFLLEIEIFKHESPPGRAELKKKKSDHFNIPLIGKLVYFSEGICKFTDQESSKYLYFFHLECQSLNIKKH